jgi:hypothetical protein
MAQADTYEVREEEGMTIDRSFVYESFARTRAEVERIRDDIRQEDENKARLLTRLSSYGITRQELEKLTQKQVKALRLGLERTSAPNA